MDSGRSQAKIDGSDFCSGGIASICAELPEPFQGLHGRQLTSRRISSVHRGDRSAIGIWSLLMAWLNLQKAAFFVKPHLKARNLRLVFTTCSPARSQGERRITQRALILTSLANSAAETRGLHCAQEAEMSLSKGYCDLYLICKAALLA